MSHTLTEDQRSFLAQCLRIAAERFTYNIIVLSEIDGLDSYTTRAMAEQFRKQAADAETLAKLVEDAGEGVVTPEVEEAARDDDQCSSCLPEAHVRCQQWAGHKGPHSCGGRSWN